jgi:queuosine precursor transporter
MFSKIRTFVKKEVEDYKYLLRAVPSLVVTLFVLSVVCMNFLANKELFNTSFLALDCGFTLSWLSFVFMDMLCKRFGAKAATKISILAIFINLCVTGIFKLLSLTPGMWGEYYTTGEIAVNNALNVTFGGTWYVVLASATAMAVSSIVNSVVNVTVAKISHDDGSYGKFALRSFVSTGIAQFVDNLAFACLCSKIFFGWTWTQVFLCSLTGAIAELLCEVILSPVGYKVSKEWEQEGVGSEYLARVRA